jgi:hypothetical protein
MVGEASRREPLLSADEDDHPKMNVIRRNCGGRARTLVRFSGGALWPLAVAGLGLLPMLAAELGSLGPVKDFKLPVFFAEQRPGQTNQLETLLTSALAQPDPKGRLRIYHLQQVRIENYGRDGTTNLIARAPGCTLDTANRVAHSAGRLELEAADGQLQLEGEGFSCQITNASLVISNRVRAVIRKDLIKTKPK